MMAEFRWAAVTLLWLGTAAQAAELVFDVEEVHPADASAAFSLRVAVVHQGRWTMRERLERKKYDAERQYRRYRNMVATVHPLFPDPLHAEWEKTRDDWMLSAMRYQALVESYGSLRWVVESSPVLRTPRLAALRISEPRLRDLAQVSEPGDEAAVRLELFRRRWFRPARLVGTVDTRIRLTPGTGSVFHFGQPGFAVKIRSRWSTNPCATELANVPRAGKDPL